MERAGVVFRRIFGFQIKKRLNGADSLGRGVANCSANEVSRVFRVRRVVRLRARKTELRNKHEGGEKPTGVRECCHRGQLIANFRALGSDRKVAPTIL